MIEVSTIHLSKFFLLSIFFIFLLIIFTFIDLPKTFYQQDEWQVLGHNLVQGIENITIYTSPIQLLFAEGRPLSTAMYFPLLGYFKFTVIPATILAIFLHFLNSVLLFQLVNFLTKNKIISLLAAAFLIVNSVSHQAVTWVSANNTLPAATLILISLITYFKYLDIKKRKYFYISIISAILSLYFKGVGLFLYILLPLLPFIYKGIPITKKNILSILRDNFIFIIFGFLMFGIRFGSVFFRTQDVAGFASGGGSGSFIYTVFLRVILYPLSSLFQIFVPPLDLYSITPVITKMQYKFLVGSPLVDLVAQSIVADMIAILGSILILLFLIFMMRRSKDKIISRNVWFAIAFFILSFLPYIVLDRESSYLSSRYFYVGAMGAGILFGYIIYFLTSAKRYAKLVVFPLVFIFLLHHANIVRGDIDYQVKLGNERRAVLNGIKTLKPELDNRTVFYVTSDKEYYGPITNPFQNGLGYVLGVWYYDSGNIPDQFLEENFLWDLGAEGYREKGDLGFGYFQDIDKMAEEMKKNNLKQDVVHAFFIRSSDTRVIDITEEIRLRISTISALTNDPPR